MGISGGISGALYRELKHRLGKGGSQIIRKEGIMGIIEETDNLNQLLQEGINE